MINKPSSIQPYVAFRFCAITNSGRIVNCSAAHHDPFLNGMWVGRAHCEGEPTLASILEHEPSLDVYLLSRGREVARKIAVSYKGLKWYPLDIDAAISGVAMEWVLLTEAKYTGCGDVELSEVPGLAGGVKERNAG